MKKLILACSLFYTLACEAQSAFSITAGPQITTADYKANKVRQPTEHKWGVFAGVGWKIPFETRVYFAPEIFYSLKGYRVQFNQYLFPPGPDARDNDTRIHCLELAALLHADLGAQPSHFFLRGGVALDFQLYGKERYRTSSGNLVEKKMIYDFGEYGRYSANAIAQIGYETEGGFFVAARYSYGIANISNADEGPNIHHVAYGLGVGFFFRNDRIVIDTRNRE
ncbi:MAG TPA: porin family protein [Chitinophagaceae bacterium]|nr:porin family protein [Chitinophagaceae bacterium]